MTDHGIGQYLDGRFQEKTNVLMQCTGTTDVTRTLVKSTLKVLRPGLIAIAFRRTIRRGKTGVH
jgi:hypothetical protein